MLGSRDDLILQRLGQIHEIVAVTGDPHNQVPVIVRMLPGPLERIAVDHIELDVMRIAGEVGANQLDDPLDPTLTLPGEMGERFKVIALSRNLDAELSGFRSRDLRERL